MYHFVGYGSLISHDSLKDTIKDKKFTPVIVKGYKRIFNLSINGKDILNLKKSPKSKFNGIIFSVNEKEFKKIKLREEEYNLEETEVYDFKTNKKIGKAFICIDYFLEIDHRKRLPNKSYFILCREAAYHLSKDFGKFWDNTTLISDNEKVSNWIKKHKEYNILK